MSKLTFIVVPLFAVLFPFLVLLPLLTCGDSNRPTTMRDGSENLNLTVSSFESRINLLNSTSSPSYGMVKIEEAGDYDNLFQRWTWESRGDGYYDMGNFIPDFFVHVYVNKFELYISFVDIKLVQFNRIWHTHEQSMEQSNRTFVEVTMRGLLKLPADGQDFVTGSIDSLELYKSNYGDLIAEFYNNDSNLLATLRGAGLVVNEYRNDIRDLMLRFEIPIKELIMRKQDVLGPE